MRIEQVEIYQYDELTVSAKENARKWFEESLNEEFSHETECITQDLTSALEEKGYEGLEVNWSLSHCQGDGVAFYGTLYTSEVLQIAKRLLSEKEYNRLEIISQCEDIVFEINNSGWGRYHHWNTMSVELIDVCYWEDYPKVWELLKKLERAIAEDIREVSKELERKGYEQIEYYFSKEYAEDEIRANDYEFDVNGGRI